MVYAATGSIVALRLNVFSYFNTPESSVCVQCVQKQDSYFQLLGCKGLFGTHIAQIAPNITLEKRIKSDCVWKWAPRCPFGIDYLLFFLEGLLHKAGFYTCVMKPF